MSKSCSPVSGSHSPVSGTRRPTVSSSNREQDSPGSAGHIAEAVGLNLTTSESKLGWECLAVHISPDLGERIMLSGERSLIEGAFPEIATPLMDARSSVAWNQDPRHVIRFPLNGYCKLNSMQVFFSSISSWSMYRPPLIVVRLNQAITRLLNADFRIVASSGGGVEGQQFSEYLFIRKALPL